MSLLLKSCGLCVRVLGGALLVAAFGLVVVDSGEVAADASPVVAQQDLVGPAGSTFGERVLVLSNGNYVVVDSGFDAGAAADVGAVYLYDGVTDTVISTLVGTSAGDGVGSGGVFEVGASNFVVTSPFWDNGATADVGAVTFADGTTGITGAVTTTNSLHGTTTNDRVGNGSVTALSNGNYTVTSWLWDNGTVVNAGAVTFGSGATGITGPVTTTNSLHGTTDSDNVGETGVTALTNGNYTVASRFWDNGTVVDAGAATFGNGTTGITGPVTTTNSLHGTATEDLVGRNGVTALTNGNYAVASSFWNNGPGLAGGDAGAVTFGNGTTGISGPVSTTNSLYGTGNSDFIGNSGVTALTNGNYIVGSPFWNNGGVVDAGAVTFGNGTIGTTGPVTTGNSLYGTTTADFGFFVGMTALTNGNYVVANPTWDNVSVVDAGAVTFGNGTTGTTGPVSTANSLYGTTTADEVGNNGVTALRNGNYTVASPSWNGVAVKAGAVTFGNGTTGTTGPVSTANSLYGTTMDDEIGGNRVAALTNGNYVVASQGWDNGATVDAGAATFGSGTTGITGPVSTANSLYGTTVGDQVGQVPVDALTNGNYVVRTPLWNKPATPAPAAPEVNDAGAVTFGDGATGIAGAVSTANSLHGSVSADQVGSGGVTALTNGLYVVTSPLWNDGGTADAGAVTFGVAAGGVVGAISTSNSAIGTPPGSVVQPGGQLTSNETLPVPTSQNRVLLLQLDLGIPVAPSAPSGVTGVAGDGEVTVSWTAPTSNGGSAITGYTVTASPGGATCTTTGATTCVVTGLTNGTAYTFTVTATNAVGTSPASSPSSPVTPVSVPSAPSGVTGVAGDGEVTVSWTAPTSSGGSPITGYTVTASPGGATCTTTGATTCVVTGLTNGTAYTFTVTAANADGIGPASTPSFPVTPVAGIRDLVTVVPARLLDTRSNGTTIDGQFLGEGKVTGGQFTRVKIAGRGGVAADAVGVELNITAIQNEGRGFATLYPCTETRPTASTLNYTPGVNIANATTVALNSAGEVCLYSNVTAHYALDVLAYVPA